MKNHHAKSIELHCHVPAAKCMPDELGTMHRVFEVSSEIAMQRHRHLSATLLLVGVLAAAACSQTKGDAQAQPSAASALTPSQPLPPSAPAPPSAGTRDAPMDPGMKDHNHPMGAGMEGHAHEHDGGHP